MAALSNVRLLLRVASILFAISELGLNAYVVYYADDYFYEDPYGDWGVNHDTPSQVAFLLFAAVWSLLVLVYFTLAPFYLITGGENASYVKKNLTHRYAIVALDTITTIFWLAGWIALAKLIGGPSTCTSFCAAIQASVAFAAFLWATFAASGLIGMWELWKRRQDKTNATEEDNHTSFGMTP
jgi:lysylphosphatidylglycerol synthetase-like protein (DUF2156 family)